MLNRIKIPKWLIYCVPVLFLMALEFTSTFHTTDSVLKDIAYQSTGQTDPRVSVIGIDEETLSAYGNMEVWGRPKLAELINYLMEDPENAPAVIAVDIGIYNKKNQEEDDRLVEAVRNAGNVVLVSAVSFENSVESEDGSNYTASQKATRIEKPFEELNGAIAATGHSNIFLDEDGYARHALGSLDVNGELVSSFAANTARLYLGEIDPRFDQLHTRFYVAYSGLPGDYFGTLGNGTSFKKVLEGEVPKQVFRNNIVFIGAYATGMQDHYYTTTHHSQMMNGVEIQANITVQIINDWYYQEANNAVRLLLILLFGVISGLVLYRTDYRKGMVIAFLVAAGYVACAIGLYHLAHAVLPLLAPILAMILPCIIRTIVEYLNLYQERQRMVSNFSRYMPQSVAEKVAQQAAGGLEENAFPGEKKDIAVMFVDIRGFTTMSESMEPEQVAHMINSFLNVTTAAVFRHGGTIDKFIGDCTMALFNAPLDQEDYVFKAISAALDIQEHIGDIPVDPDDPTKIVRVGIGIDCGEAMVGSIGTQFRMDYTAIGDTVNTASRMEGQAKAGEILISANVYERVKDRINCEYRGGVQLKGKKQPVDTYLVTGVKQPAEENK